MSKRSRSGEWLGLLVAVIAVGAGILTTALLLDVNSNRGSLGSGRVPEQNNPYVLAILGDSLVEGVGAASPEETLGYRLFTKLKSEKPNAKLLNVGVSGARSEAVATDQVSRALTTNPAIAVVVVGTNDVINGINAQDYEADMKKILEGLAKDERKVIIANIPRFSQTPAIPENRREAADAQTALFNARLKALAANYENTTIFDFYELSNKRLQPGSALLSDDKFHPNSAGYEELANALYPLLTTL